MHDFKSLFTSGKYILSYPEDFVKHFFAVFRNFHSKTAVIGLPNLIIISSDPVRSSGNVHIGRLYLLTFLLGAVHDLSHFAECNAVCNDFRYILLRRTLAEILDENLLNVKIRTELGLFELNAGLSAVAVVLDEVKVIALAVAKCKLCRESRETNILSQKRETYRLLFLRFASSLRDNRPDLRSSPCLK